VRDYLVDHGISGPRLQYTGLGCEGMSEHKDNRRVAIRILEK
jgi:outer membrane protein OmpA-like peptidoglycan-associated protein